MKNILTFFIVFTLNLVFSQKNCFEITKLGNQYTRSQLENAVFQADWCGYFHSSERYQLIFDDGAIVELLSMTEAFDIKNKLSETCFQNERTKDNGTFKIHKSGVLMRMLSARNTSKN
jgi:hypothetical protein